MPEIYSSILLSRLTTSSRFIRLFLAPTRSSRSGTHTRSRHRLKLRSRPDKGRKSPPIRDVRAVASVHAVYPGTWAFHCHILSHVEGPQGMFGMVTALVVS